MNDDRLPDDVLRKLAEIVFDATADADPDARDRLARAFTAGTIDARARIVGDHVYVYLRAYLDDGTTDDMEVPGSAVGLYAFGDEIAVIP